MNDGAVDSAPKEIDITVSPVNTQPIITGQQLYPLRKMAHNASLADLQITDDSPPGGFTMTASQGSNYTAEGLKITPTANFDEHFPYLYCQ